MVELIAGPVVMAFGAVIVTMATLGRTPSWRATQLVRSSGKLRNATERTPSAAAGRAAKPLEAITPGQVGGQTELRDSTAIAEDTMSALLSELLTLKEEVEVLRNQIDGSRPPTQKAPPRANSRPTRRLPVTRSA